MEFHINVFKKNQFIQNKFLSPFYQIHVTCLFMLLAGNGILHYSMFYHNSDCLF